MIFLISLLAFLIGYRMGQEQAKIEIEDLTQQLEELIEKHGNPNNHSV